MLLYKDISKRMRNGIRARIISCVNKYGFERTRITVGRYFSEVIERDKLQQLILAKEKELKNLKEG